MIYYIIKKNSNLIIKIYPNYDFRIDNFIYTNLSKYELNYKKTHFINNIKLKSFNNKNSIIFKNIISLINYNKTNISYNKNLFLEKKHIIL